jgi:hypothetical protein
LKAHVRLELYCSGRIKERPGWAIYEQDIASGAPVGLGKMGRYGRLTVLMKAVRD